MIGGGTQNIQFSLAEGAAGAHERAGRDFRIDVPAAGHHTPDNLGQFFGRRGLGYKPRSPRGEGASEDSGPGMTGHHDD